MGAQHVIIVGAGIVGASIAHALSHNGINVTVVDALESPGLGVSAASFGWITCAAGEPDIPEAVYRSRLEAIDNYKNLDAEFGGQIYAPSKGALVWGANDVETLDWAERHEARGSQVRLVSRKEITAMEPLIAAPPALAAHFPREKAVDVREACALLIRSAREAGAQILIGQKVQSLDIIGGRIAGVRLADRRVAADQVVVAAGVQSPALIADVMPEHGVYMSSAALITLQVDSGRFAHILDGDGLEIRSRRNGAMIVASGIEDGPEDLVKANLARDVLTKVRRTFPAIVNPRVTGVQIGHRPFLAGDRPLVSVAPDVEGLLLAVSHPGVILAPEIARQIGAMISL
ncbi:FAD-dependent oxidoreductase [Hoeflea sp. AS60]|uniref:NAD(P)/FAD-dependent oxidoreductase n=1 Tax=Hoeflea sp. AS60 TaxID=3135780 RepID=UPI003170D872